MKKIVGWVLLLCAAWAFPACDDNKSYAEMLEDERDAIERLIDEEGIVVLDEYPADGVFAENEFYLMDNDVYINVIDSGNGNHMGTRQNVICRFKARIFKSDTAEVDGFSSSAFPVTMICSYSSYYNTIQAYASNEDGNNYFANFVSEGLASGLQYVGDSSEVKLIVPFKVSSSMFYQTGDPVYYERVRYIFEK